MMNIRLNHIIFFIKILNSYQNRNYDYLNNMYEKGAENFQGACTFLGDFELISINNRQITCSNEFTSFLIGLKKETTYEEAVKQFFIKEIQSDKTKNAHQFCEYLEKFKYQMVVSYITHLERKTLVHFLFEIS